MKYTIEASLNGQQQTTIKCTEERLIQWIDYLLGKGYQFNINYQKQENNGK